MLVSVWMHLQVRAAANQNLLGQNFLENNRNDSLSFALSVTFNHVLARSTRNCASSGLNCV